MPISQRDPELASLGHRLGASGIDAGCVVCGMACLMGPMAIWSRVRDGNVWEGLEKRATRLADSLNPRRDEPLMTLATAVNRRNWRSPGMYLMHLRRCDARTGGPVTVRSAVIRHLVDQARDRLISRLLTPRIERYQASMNAIQPELDAARRQHPDDFAAQQQAISQIYSDAGVNPTGGCWLPLLPLAVRGADGLMVLFMPRRQSPPDWLAGIVTVRD
jgi:hypothetical protein